MAQWPLACHHAVEWRLAMRATCLGLAAAISVLCLAVPASAERLRIAVFDFTLVNTSLAAVTQQEMARLRKMDDDLKALLAASGQYEPVDISPLRERIASGPDIRDCNGCERELAVSLGASLAAYGWVQKVSNLILNINLVIEDAATGRRLKAGSVDIRGNTDESWSRGLRYMLSEHVLDAAP
jgi:hypothetical protein